VTELAIKETTTSMDVDPVRFASDVDIPVNQAQLLVPVLPTIIALVVARSENAEDFARGLCAAGLSEPEGDGIVVELLRPIIASRSVLRRAIQESHLADTILPSFMGLSVTIDVRLSFEDTAVDLAVPVAVIFLKTDIRDVDLTFQAKISDVRRLISGLTEALQQLEKAQSWAAERTK